MRTPSRARTKVFFSICYPDNSLPQGHSYYTHTLIETRIVSADTEKKLSTILDYFTCLTYLYEKDNNMKAKRQYRELADETKKKISASSTNKPKSEAHKQHISQAMVKYWQTVPHRPSSGETV